MMKDFRGHEIWLPKMTLVNEIHDFSSLPMTSC